MFLITHSHLLNYHNGTLEEFKHIKINRAFFGNKLEGKNAEL